MQMQTSFTILTILGDRILLGGGVYINTLKQELFGTRAYQEKDSDEMYVVNAHLNELSVTFSICFSECQDKLLTMSGYLQRPN